MKNKNIQSRKPTRCSTAARRGRGSSRSCGVWHRSSQPPRPVSRRFTPCPPAHPRTSSSRSSSEISSSSARPPRLARSTPGAAAAAAPPPGSPSSDRVSEPEEEPEQEDPAARGRSAATETFSSMAGDSQRAHCSHRAALSPTEPRGAPRAAGGGGRRGRPGGASWRGGAVRAVRRGRQVAGRGGSVGPCGRCAAEREDRWPGSAAFDRGRCSHGGRAFSSQCAYGKEAACSSSQLGAACEIPRWRLWGLTLKQTLAIGFVDGFQRQ